MNRNFVRKSCFGRNFHVVKSKDKKSKSSEILAIFSPNQIFLDLIASKDFRNPSSDE